MQKVKKMSANIISSLAIVASLLGLGVAYAPGAQALECAMLPQAICDKSDDNSTQGGVYVLLKWVLKIMIGVVGVAAIGGVIWAGVMYLTSGDNTSQIKQAKTIIVDVAIGLIAFGLMFLITNWLIPGGVLG